MHSLKDELKTVLNNEKQKQEFVSLEEFLNNDFETINNKKFQDVEVAFNTLVSMHTKYKESNPYSMESRSYQISMEGFFKNFFDKLVDLLVSVLGFIYDLVVRIINSIASMFKTKKPKEAELIINNYTKMIAYTYMNNITKNDTLRDNSKTLKNVRTGLEFTVKAQSSLIAGLHEVVLGFTGNPLMGISPEFNTTDIIDRIFDFDDFHPLRLNVDRFKDAISNMSEVKNISDIIYSTAYSKFNDNTLVKFKLIKDKVELEKHNYVKEPIEITMDTTIQHLKEEELVALFKDITDNDVKQTIEEIEKFIEDSKQNKTNVLGDVSGYNRKAENTAKEILKLLKASNHFKYEHNERYEQHIDIIKRLIKIATNINKFSITYLKDILVSTMQTYNAVPEMYTTPEAE